MELQGNNEKAFLKYRKELLNVLKEQEENRESGRVKNMLSLPTKEEWKAFSAEVNGKQYRFNSAFRPSVEAEKWISQYSFLNGEIVVAMFGMGNGIFAKKIAEKMEKDARLVIYEPSLECFSFIIENYDISSLIKDGRVFFVIDKINTTTFRDLMQQLVSYVNVNSQIVCCHPIYDEAFPKEYREFLKVLNDNKERAYVNRNTLAYFGKGIAKNTIANLDCLKNSNTLEELKGKIPTDVPAIIVSAGPSLDKNIEELKNAIGKAIIICTDTAYKMLYEHEILPDFIISIDPYKWIGHFKKYETYQQIPLFTKIEANQKILTSHIARKILFNCQPYLCRIYEKMNKTIPELGAGGSVATAAFAICVELRMKTIILVGQDLAFSGEITHAGGKITMGINRNDKGNVFVTGIDGNKVRTREDWKSYLKWFENALVKIKESKVEIRTIDATEGGAKIEGTEIMTLQEAIQTYCDKEIDTRKILDELPVTMDDTEFRCFKTYLNTAVSDMKKIKKKAEESIIICNKILNEFKKSKTETYIARELAAKLYRLNEEINNCDVYLLLNDYIAQISTEKLDGLYQMSENETENNRRVYSRAQKIYVAIIDSVDALILELQNKIDGMNTKE